MDTTAEKIQQLQQQKINLVCDLTSPYSEIGDYRVTKIYEARLLGEADPYDAKELLDKRQKARDEINTLEMQIAELQKAETADVTTETEA